jgi:hypothetical protein
LVFNFFVNRAQFLRRWLYLPKYNTRDFSKQIQNKYNGSDIQKWK